jgi:hypothetical protein
MVASRPSAGHSVSHCRRPGFNRRLYTLFISGDQREHLLKLEISKAGLSAFSFTLG